MASPNLNLFNVPTISDFQREEEEFNLRKQLAQAKLISDASGGSRPAALQIADEYAKARQSGDIQRMNDIALAAKTFDRGIVYGEQGTPTALAGYGDALGNIKFGQEYGGETGAQRAKTENEPYRAGLTREAEKTVDLQFNPQISRAEKDQTNASNLFYEPLTREQIAKKEAAVKNQAAMEEQVLKKTAQATDNLSIIQEILRPDERGRTVLDRATGSGIGALVAGGKQFLGQSDEETQANAQLAIYGGRLLNNVPRMEGPQSDADRKSYMEQAGKIADPRVPAADKKAALAITQSLSEKYSRPIEGTKNGRVDIGRIPGKAVAALKANPSLRDQFDMKYGQGAADMIIGN